MFPVKHWQKSICKQVITYFQGNWEYTSTKYGLRGFMKAVRRSGWEQGIRINYVAPCWIRSAIRTKEYEAWLVAQGIEFGEQADCAGAMMRIACDKSINGMYCTISLSRLWATGKKLGIIFPYHSTVPN